MNTRTCKSCGHEFHEWVELCPNCSEPMEDYSRPAGFWVRFGAYIIDALIFTPFGLLSFFNMYKFKSTVLLVAISLPYLFYKPLMESFCGATLGKMACGIKVIDSQGKKLSLLNAYARYLPFLAGAAIGLVNSLVLFSLPEFQSAESFMEIAQARQGRTLLDIIGIVVNIFVVIECIVAAFSYRKRALHDMLAESFCVYKEPKAELNTDAAVGDGAC